MDESIRREVDDNLWRATTERGWIEEWLRLGHSTVTVVPVPI